jgi:hypothetical protein
VPVDKSASGPPGARQGGTPVNPISYAQNVPPPERLKTYARIAGVLFLLSMFAGFFGELYIPSQFIVLSDAATTAHNIRSSETLFRLGFAAYLVEALCDVSLSLVLYALLKTVDEDWALLAAFFGLLATALFAVSELFYFGAAIVLRSADSLKAFTPDQVDGLALLSLKLYVYGGGIFMVFFGVAAMLRGYLIYRSRFLPKTLGALLMLAGFGFIAKNFALVVAPAYASNLLMAPMFVAGLALTGWMLVKGVDLKAVPQGPALSR